MNAWRNVGDMSHLFPVMRVTFGGFDGALHSQEFLYYDTRSAYIESGKLFALPVAAFRETEEKRKKVIKEYVPVSDREAPVVC